MLPRPDERREDVLPRGEGLLSEVDDTLLRCNAEEELLSWEGLAWGK